MLSVIWALPWVRKLAFVAGIVVLLGVLALTIFLKGRSSGLLAAKIDAMTKALAAERRMKDAAADSPSSPSDVSKRLRDSKF